MFSRNSPFPSRARPVVDFNYYYYHFFFFINVFSSPWQSNIFTFLAVTRPLQPVPISVFILPLLSLCSVYQTERKIGGKRIIRYFSWFCRQAHFTKANKFTDNFVFLHLFTLLMKRTFVGRTSVGRRGFFVEKRQTLPGTRESFAGNGGPISTISCGRLSRCRLYQRTGAATVFATCECPAGYPPYKRNGRAAKTIKAHVHVYTRYTCSV